MLTRAELDKLRTELELGRGFIVVRIDAVGERRWLVEWLSEVFPDRQIGVVQFAAGAEPIRQLRDADASADLLVASGEEWISGPARKIWYDALNDGRDGLRDVEAPILFVVDEGGLTDLAQRAPDAWAWRGGVYGDAPTRERQAPSATHSQPTDQTEQWSLGGLLGLAAQLEPFNIVFRTDWIWPVDRTLSNTLSTIEEWFKRDVSTIFIVSGVNSLLFSRTSLTNVLYDYGARALRHKKIRSVIGYSGQPTYRPQHAIIDFLRSERETLNNPAEILSLGAFMRDSHLSKSPTVQKLLRPLQSIENASDLASNLLKQHHLKLSGCRYVWSCHHRHWSIEEYLLLIQHLYKLSNQGPHLRHLLVVPMRVWDLLSRTPLVDTDRALLLPPHYQEDSLSPSVIRWMNDYLKTLLTSSELIDPNAQNTLIGLSGGLPGYAHSLLRNATRQAIYRGANTISPDDVHTGAQEFRNRLKFSESELSTLRQAHTLPPDEAGIHQAPDLIERGWILPTTTGWRLHPLLKGHL